MKKLSGLFFITGIFFLACNAQKSVEPGNSDVIPIGSDRTQILDSAANDDQDTTTSKDTTKALPGTIRRNKP
jgi:hypothetical protein